MVNQIYFFDSYAIIEMINKNPNYRPYLQARMATTMLNLIEVHYALLRTKGPKTALAYFKPLISATIPFEKAIPDANVLKYVMKKRRLSSPDCIGYLIAKIHKIKFLTGDREFKDMPNVEFVK